MIQFDSTSDPALFESTLELAQRQVKRLVAGAKGAGRRVDEFLPEAKILEEIAQRGLAQTTTWARRSMA